MKAASPVRRGAVGNLRTVDSARRETPRRPARRWLPTLLRRALRAGLPVQRRAADPEANDAPAAVWCFAYDGSGRLVFQGSRPAPTDGVPFARTGRDYVTDTNLQYNRVRSCDPTPGVWLIEEPVAFLGNDANLHRHVGNAPPTPSETE